ncbi:MAG: hypothetical protein H7Y38_11105 [Armatimonadetes bacterium]|nr:hypothetical protein [Armatimonadota bacterium]
MNRSRFDSRALFAGLTGVAVVSAVCVGMLGKPEPVQAFPKFSNDEGVKCAYCHVNANGGGKRNYRGKFYKKAGLSFAGFDDKAEAAAAGEPLGEFADAKPKSLTGVSPAATPAPVPTEAPAKSAVGGYRVRASKTALALKKSPTPAAKKAHSASLTLLARAIMDDPSIIPAKKYPEALALSRQAVALDKANQMAAMDVAKIVGVYKQMGKPVPK